VSRARRVVWAVGTALALTVPVAVLVAAAATSPASQLRASVAEVVRVVSDPGLEARALERRQAIRRVAAEIFDFAEITRRVCGPHWSARTPAEREELTGLFRGLLERAYIARIEQYRGEQVVFAGESVDGDVATVRTRIVSRQGLEIPVDYRMLRRDERWVAYDVVIEGASLVANYRGQFNRILQGGSYAELVRRLRATLQRPEADDAAAARTSRAQ